MLSSLHDHSATGCQSGSQLPGLHQHGEVPWDDLAHHSNRFSSGAEIEVSFDGNGLSSDFVDPASIVPVVHMSLVHISHTGNVDWLAIIDGLHSGQIVTVLFDEIGQSEETPGSFDGIHSSPRSLFEGSPGGIDSSIDIFRGSSLDGGQDGLIIGVDDVHGPSFDGVDKLSIDEKLLYQVKFGYVHNFQNIFITNSC